MERDWDVRAGELSAEAISAGEPTAWFDRLYAAGAAGEVSMPWDRDEPQVLLHEWLERHDVRGGGRRAVVVGCGLGADAEHLAERGFAVTAFDVAATAVELARERHPGSPVDYHVADLLDLPADWSHAFDLVLEIFTLQALPDPPRAAAVRAVAGLVAPGGRLLVIAFRGEGEADSPVGPPFPLGRGTVDALATDGLRQAEVEALDEPPRWRVRYEAMRCEAGFRRPSGPATCCGRTAACRRPSRSGGS